MGKHKFRLSDMMPNAWFYKLKDMTNKPRNQNTNHKKPPQPPPSSSSSSSLSSSTTTTTSLSFSSKTKQSSQPHHHCRSRKSYYFTRDLNNANDDDDRPFSSPTTTTQNPRKPSKQRLRRRRPTKSSSSPSPKLYPITTTTTTSSSVSSGFSCRAKLQSVFTKPVVSLSSSSSSPLCSSPEKDIPDELEFRCDRILTTFDGMVSTTCRCSHHQNDQEDKQNDVVVDKASLPSRKTGSLSEKRFDSFSELELPPPIITKPIKKHDTNLSGSTLVRKFPSPNHKNSSSSSSHGVKLRIHSPRIVGKRVAARKSVSAPKNSSSSAAAGSGEQRLLKKRSVSESFAIVKSSFDPQKDFRESMVEMIVENNIRASKDLEDLLACYLSLNSDEYHDLIIKVFKQIWFDLTDLSSK